MVTLDGPGSLDLDAYRRVVGGEPTVTTAAALERVRAGRAALDRHHAEGGSTYGVTTGLGLLASRAVGEDDQAALQLSLVTARASGLDGELPAPLVRGVLLLRLAGFLSGHVGVTVELCRLLDRLLALGWQPVVPAGPYGAAGEIGPLAHLFQTIVGEGRVVLDGEELPAAAALARAGVEPYSLRSREGLALVNGSPFATAAVVEAAGRVRGVLARANAAAALAAAVLGASTRPYGARVAALSGDEAIERVAADLRALLAGGPAYADLPQAPVSVRVAPQVHGALERAAELLEDEARRRLAAVTDSPLLLDGAGEEPAGTYPSGGFHATAPTVALEAATIAVAHVVNLVEKRLHRLLDGRFSGLPDQLARRPGRQAGAIALHKAAVGLAVEVRLLAAPASVHALDTSTGQEDVQVHTLVAFGRLQRAVEHLETAVACELVALRHAAALRPEPVEAPALRALLDALGEVSPPLEEDRTLTGEVQRVRALLRAGGLPS